MIYQRDYKAVSWCVKTTDPHYCVRMSDDVWTRLADLDSTSLADASPELAVLPTDLRPLGRARRLVGRAVTADAQGDLMSVIAGLAVSGPGDVLVVAVGDDERAVAGELFATEAVRRGLAGLVIDGRCRDSAIVAELDLPVFARGVAPNAYPAVKVPRIQEPIMIGSVVINPGDVIVGDDDGLVAGSVAAVTAAVEKAEAIQARERRLRSAIEAGSSLFDALNVDEHVAALQAGQPSSLAFRELGEPLS